jgi:protein involved in polysaccharide export with SLBB domain
MFLHACFTRIGWPSVLTAVCILAGCFGARGQDAAATAIVSGTNQFAAAAGNTNADNSIWVLSPNDEIGMTVFQEDDLATKTTVDVNGMLMLPLLGEVKVGGMTLAQATARIQQLYDKDYLVNPKVNLIVEKFAERHFAVLGQVQRPGSYNFPQNEPVNLLEAIAMAGSYTRLGKPSNVSVRRIENETPKIYHLDADQLAQDPKKNNFQVLPNDVITVGERTF